jgi:hypothetical protein
METPGSVPSAEAENAPLVTGQVVPPGSVLPESDPPGEDDVFQQPSRRRAWLFVFKPRWLAWHLLVAVLFCVMLGLGDWQYHRAVGGNGLSWAYTFEWPLFAAFAVVFWARTLRDEYLQRRHGGLTEAQLLIRAEIARSMATLPPGAILPAGRLPDGMYVRQVEQALQNDADDPELARYNHYLAKLSAKDRRKALGAG